MGLVMFDQNIMAVKREGGDRGAGNTKHQWRCRLLGQSGIWREKVPCQTLLTNSSGHW